MWYLGGLVALSLIASIYTAPESSPVLQPLRTGHISESSPDHNRTKPSEGSVDLSGPVVPAEKSSGGSTSNKKGELDRGLVSDVIESTLSGVHLGFAIGGNNGTLDRLCIKLGNITMAGCRRTASLDKKISKEDNKTKSPEHS